MVDTTDSVPVRTKTQGPVNNIKRTTRNILPAGTHAVYLTHTQVITVRFKAKMARSRKARKFSSETSNLVHGCSSLEHNAGSEGCTVDFETSTIPPIEIRFFIQMMVRVAASPSERTIISHDCANTLIEIISKFQPLCYSSLMWKRTLVTEACWMTAVSLLSRFVGRCSSHQIKNFGQF